MTYWGFPDRSVGKESACNAGDPGSIPGSGRSTGEGIGYPLLYSWASLVAQTVKNPPAMQETGFNPGSGRSLEGGNGNPLQYSCLGNPMDREVWRARVHGVTISWTRLHTRVIIRNNFTYFPTWIPFIYLPFYIRLDRLFVLCWMQVHTHTHIYLSNPEPTA